MNCNSNNNSCATFTFTNCVLWSGGTLDCIPTCKDMTLTTLISNISEKVCELYSTRTPDLSDLNWGCISPSPVPIDYKSSIQALIDKSIEQVINYDNTEFTVTGENCEKVLNIKQGEWVDITSDIIFYNGFSSSSIEYMLEPATNTVRLRGTVSRPTRIVLSAGGYTFSGSGNGIIVMDLPAYLRPTGAYLTCSPGINDSYRYSPGANVTQYYNLTWITSFASTSGVARLTTYVPYAATQDGASTSGGTSVSMYLHNFSYSLN